ncbi:unnamed protein product [Sphagnum balticum]
MASFEPRGGGTGTKAGEAIATGVTTAAPPSAATSSYLCCLWVLPIRMGDEDAIAFNLLASASNLLATTAFAFHLEFQ